MNIDALYDSLFSRLLVVSSYLSTDQAEEIEKQISLACADSRLSTAASKALNELSSHLESSLSSTPEMWETFKETLRPWIELQKLHDELGVDEGKIKEAECSKKSGDEAVAALMELTKRIEEVRQKIVAVESTLAPPELSCAQACAGLRNRSNRCFIHAIVKSIWASHAFRRLVAAKATSKTALLLDRLFQKLDATPASTILEPHDEAVLKLLAEIGKNHPQILDGEQHDASEFLECLFTDMLAEGEYLFSYDVSKKRPRELEGDFSIPTIDLKEHVDGNVFLVNLPSKEGSYVELQEAVTASLSEETIDPEAIANSERNVGKNRREILASLERAPREVRVERTILFSPPLPSCLLVQLVPAARQVLDIDPKLADLTPEERAVIETDAHRRSLKVPVRVHVPHTLTIKSQVAQSYTLKGIVIHKGEQCSGHYFAILPEEAPHQFVRHDDEAVSRVFGSDGAHLDLEQNGYLLVYDID